ncbi:hypothetical protein LXL04_009354 [Taraxacum kok-saghyz]
MSSRRRLRIVCSSDEEDEHDEIQEVQPPPPQHDDIECETLNFQDVTLSSINTNPTNPSASIQVDISDDDFIDAAEDLFHSPQSPPPPPPLNQTVYSLDYSIASSVGSNEPSGSPISKILEDLGLRLRGEWLDACLLGLQTAIPGFSSFDATKKAKLCFEKFLHSDMNHCGAGFLPDNVHQMHLVDLPGPFVLQVDEIVNISQPLRERYKKANCGLKRCLKLSMTDGVQRVFGMEYQPIKDLEALAPAGLKVAISNVNVRHGLLMLVPEVIQVLGGLVEDLDAARQRLVDEVNKPPRGRRTRTGVVPSLATRATLAAWPADNVHGSGPSVNPVSQNAAPVHVNDQGTVASDNGRVPLNSSGPVHRENVTGPSNNPVFQNVTPVHVDNQGATPPFNGIFSSRASVPAQREHVSGPSNTSSVFQNATSVQVDDHGSTPPCANGRVSSNSSVPTHTEYVPINPVHQNATPIQIDDEGTAASVNGRVPSNNHVFQNVTPVHVDNQSTTPPFNGIFTSRASVPAHREHVSRPSNTTSVFQNASPIQVDDEGTTPPFNGRFSSNSSVPFHREHVSGPSDTNSVFQNATPIQVDDQGPTPPSVNRRVSSISSVPMHTDHVESDVDFSKVRDAHMASIQENISPAAYGRNNESPFTYMASLSVKWAESKDNASHVQCKIKCFMTGVKGFQYKNRTTYELQAYVDDGSLISEIFIHHNVVQRKIGYSPEEVNAALSSSDPSRVQDMKNTMKQFQVFLVNFEGTMVVRINETSSLPVAIEMQQGCPLSDAWSLLTRLKSSNTLHSHPIHLSP